MMNIHSDMIRTLLRTGGTMNIDKSLQGLKNAERQMTRSASRIAQWGLSSDNNASTDPLNQDSVALNGVARPRLYANSPARVHSLADEAIQLKQAEFAYRANLGAIDSLLDMDSALLEITDSANDDSSS
jgi:hypothetical protein